MLSDRIGILLFLINHCRAVQRTLVLDGQAPDHTTISRRARKLGKLPICAPAGNRPVHILVDSTGLSIHVGNLRNPPRDRDWRKLHIAVDALTGEVIASDLTSKSARDASRVPAPIKEIERPLGSVCADGAYDNEDVYEAVENHGTCNVDEQGTEPKYSITSQTRIVSYVSAIVGVPATALAVAPQACGDPSHASCANMFQNDVAHFGGANAVTIYPLAQQIDTTASDVRVATYSPTDAQGMGFPAIVVMSGIQDGWLMTIATFGDRTTCH